MFRNFFSQKWVRSDEVRNDGLAALRVVLLELLQVEPEMFATSWLVWSVVLRIKAMKSFHENISDHSKVEVSFLLK
jgi:hypothetical protein